MKDQITTMMEALRLSRLELDRFRYRTQGLETTVDNVERILTTPEVTNAINLTGSLVKSPSIVPDPAMHN